MKYSYALVLLGMRLAVNAYPYPQGVTAKIAPSAPAPAGCYAMSPGTFGIAVLPLSPARGKRNIFGGPVSQIGDGQVQVPTYTMVPITQIGDGQIQGPAGTTYTMVPITQIGDGQIQAPSVAPYPIITQISDGQVQAPSRTPSFVTITIQSTTTISRAPVTQINDAQIQAPTTTHMITSVWKTTMTVPASAASPLATSVKPTSSGADSGTGSVACKMHGSLELSLSDGVLTDSMGRTGYIASNHQFQFDDPPQAGSIFTSGFSTCKNGTLALGGSTVWWQCLSGDFYNLYNRNWAAQCEPISLTTVKLVDC